MRSVQIAQDVTEPGERRALPGLDAEHLRKLRHEDDDGDTVHESHGHGLGEEVGHEPEAQQGRPGKEDRHPQGHQCRERAETERIACRQRDEARGDERRHRHVGADNHLPRAAEQREHGQRQHQRVQTGHGQSRQLAGRQGGRDQYGANGDAGGKIRGQPGRLVGAQPGQGENEARQCPRVYSVRGHFVRVRSRRGSRSAS